MKNQIVLVSFIIFISLMVLAACSSDQRAFVQTLIAPTDQSNDGQAVAAAPTASQSPAGFTVLTTPTLDPIASGPMGTWTAIAQTVAPPTQDTTPYEIVLTGRPHFIEFHAWW